MYRPVYVPTHHILHGVTTVPNFVLALSTFANSFLIDDNPSSFASHRRIRLVLEPCSLVADSGPLRSRRSAMKASRGNVRFRSRSLPFPLPPRHEFSILLSDQGVHRS